MISAKEAKEITSRFFEERVKNEYSSVMTELEILINKKTKIGESLVYISTENISIQTVEKIIAELENIGYLTTHYNPFLAVSWYG